VYVRVKTYMLADRVENLNTAQIRDPEINLVLLQCFHLTLDRIHTQTHRIMLSAADNVSAEHTDKTQCCSASEMMTSYNMQEMIIRAKTKRERRKMEQKSQGGVGLILGSKWSSGPIKTCRSLR